MKIKNEITMKMKMKNEMKMKINKWKIHMCVLWPGPADIWPGPADLWPGRRPGPAPHPIVYVRRWLARVART